MRHRLISASSSVPPQRISDEHARVYALGRSIESGPPVRVAQGRRTSGAEAFEHRHCLALGQFPAIRLPKPGLHPSEDRAIAGLVEIRISGEPACAGIAHMAANDVDAEAVALRAARMPARKGRTLPHFLSETCMPLKSSASSSPICLPLTFSTTPFEFLSSATFPPPATATLACPAV